MHDARTLFGAGVRLRAGEPNRESISICIVSPTIAVENLIIFHGEIYNARATGVSFRRAESEVMTSSLCLDLYLDLSALI
jgi:hypothetical protein